ncbi:1-deoxy-D-xylulose-5-phosphate synthase [Flavobacteriaceae bacterium]|jgi:1-deoxy-D-xylulose-5-phosphate synthase|nr:1-deoxy-D-xylulose-5-phosphate synthase [Flavobacteriaceae bacterium]MDC3319347.1 1-deoxy-D-xylulose-5-phosphate synthase [Flavobacteriaceae bacterium]
MSNALLDTIKFPSDLRKLTKDQLPKLAKELRAFIIDIVATKQGHLGASLGVVELTIALHYLFDTPKDLLVWDVGHQAYGHKILTGRKDIFHTNRQLNGISGFPKRGESEYDTFGVGHSSTSISAALGMAIASSLKGETEKQHIAVIGDASIASGMAFEALNHAGVSAANILIILNDNAIGIDPSVGALKEYLTQVKTDRSLAQNNIIKALSFDYSGPIDGHNFKSLLRELKRLKNKKGPKFLHVITTKGKGLSQAEKDQVTYHSPGQFDAKTGEIIPKNSKGLSPKYQDVFGETIVELARENTKIIGITPAMLSGSSLKMMLKEFPERTFDVGIAEQHAVTLAAGMATQGMIPFCNIYSTFIQRAYDQIIHDVALQNLPVVFCIDRAGLVGEDGATHHGVFDLAYMRAIPNMIVFAPRNEVELRNILYTSQLGLHQPIAIRYPRGRGVLIDWKKPFEIIEIGTGVCLRDGEDIAILSIGTIGNNVTKALEEFPNIAHYDMRFSKPLDEKLVHNICANYKQIITLEDGVEKGGFGSAILEFMGKHNYKNKVKVLGIQDHFVEHGTIEELQKKNGIDISSIKKLIRRLS